MRVLLLTVILRIGPRFLRRKAAKALGDMDDPKAITPLVAALSQDSGEHVRIEAARALGGFADAKVIEALIAALRDDSYGEVRRFLGRLGQPAIGPLMAKLLDDDESIRFNAAEALVRVGPTAIEPLLEAMHDPNWQVRQASVVAFGFFYKFPSTLWREKSVHLFRVHLDKEQHAHIYEALVGAVNDPSARVQQAVATSLGNMGLGVEVLKEMLETAQEPVRLAAAGALMRIRGKLALNAIVDGLRRGDVDVRLALLRVIPGVLRSFKEDILAWAGIAEPSRGWLVYEKSETRFKVGESTTTVMAALIELSGDTNRHVREAALVALERLHATLEHLRLKGPTSDAHLRAGSSLGPHEELGMLARVVLLLVALKKTAQEKAPARVLDRLERKPVEDDRRLGVDAFLDGRLLEHALIANRKTVIEVSIGPEGTAREQLTEPVDLDFRDRDLLSLPVRFVHDGVDAQKMMHVRRDPTTRASVTFEVTPAGAHFNALIVVYDEDGSTVIEGAAFSAAVVATDEEQQRSPETIQLVRVPVAGLAEPRTDAVGSVVTDGERAVVAAPQIPIRATPEAAVAGVASVMNTFRTAARNYVATHGNFDITAALVAAAQAGYRLRTRCGLDALRDLDRIQVISFFSQSTFPLELVYDGEPPADEATRCDGWQQALETGTCPSCGDTADTSRICPLRFWGLSKVIEHHVGNTEGNIPFTARQRFSADAKQIAAPSSTVIGASVEVIKALAEAASADTGREALLADVVAEADAFGVSSVVHDWEEWCKEISESNPNLLVAMPHQDTKGDSPALELGGELEDTIEEKHVRKAGEEPGPIVLLLGCDTSTASDLIGSFASDMRCYAPVVVATIGKVVAEEAPLVASIVIDSLVHAMRQPRATIGTALLEARRALLAKSRVVGLLLVGHGDARWEVQAS